MLPFHSFPYSNPRGSWEFLLAPPPPDLVGIVEAFWISRGAVTFLHEKILPQNNIELMFNLALPFGVPNRPPAHRTFRRAWISGMQQEWLLVTPQYNTSEASYLLSVRMPPTGAYRVLGMPLQEVALNVIEVDDVLGDDVNRVHEQLGNCARPGQQFGILCDFVRRRLARSRVNLHADAMLAIRALARSHGAARIENICRTLGVSRKHLRTLLHAHVGLSPKSYARMFRFRRVVDLVDRRAQQLDWAQLAMVCGYFDQSHFNREFRTFAGMTPMEYATSGSVDGLTVLG
jgi:AraC-like DNA-binding protein